jgi:hypothetical protein
MGPSCGGSVRVPGAREHIQRKSRKSYAKTAKATQKPQKNFLSKDFFFAVFAVFA